MADQLGEVTPLPCAGHVNTASADYATFYPCPDIDGIKREHCDAGTGCVLFKLGLVKLTGDGCMRIDPSGEFRKKGAGDVSWINNSIKV